MYGFNGSPVHGWSIRKILLLIIFLICFKAAFNQACLASAGYLTTSEKFIGSGAKCDTSDPDSTKVGNELFNSFTTLLKTLCKNYPSSSPRVLLLSVHF